MAKTAKKNGEREQLFEDIQMLCGGHSCEVALSAVIDTLSALIAFSANDRAHASELVRAFGPDVEKTISDNWDYVREIRATQFSHGNTVQ